MLNRQFFDKWTPTVSRRCLMTAAGIMWTGVGTALSTIACYRLFHMDWPQAALGTPAGLLLGLAIARFSFSKIAAKNITRIRRKPERNCFFAFQTRRSYLLIFVMMAFGHVLRHSPLPRVIPAVIYLAIGVALALSSSLYYAGSADPFEEVPEATPQPLESP